MSSPSLRPSRRSTVLITTLMMSMFFHSLKPPMLYVSAVLPLWKITSMPRACSSTYSQSRTFSPLPYTGSGSFLFLSPCWQSRGCAGCTSYPRRRNPSRTPGDVPLLLFYTLAACSSDSVPITLVRAKVNGSLMLRST